MGKKIRGQKRELTLKDYDRAVKKRNKKSQYRVIVRRKKQDPIDQFDAYMEANGQ